MTTVVAELPATVNRHVVILDRDGVINEDSPSFIRHPEEWHPLPGSLEAIGTLTAAGVQVFVATNQSGIGRGLYDEAALAAIHARMTAALERHGGHLSGIVYCPHHPEDGCSCRKPRPGLIEQVAALGADTRQAAFVGDSARDIEAAMSGGCQPVLVMTGNGQVATTAVPASVPRFADLDAFVRAYVNLLADGDAKP